MYSHEKILVFGGIALVLANLFTAAIRDENRRFHVRSAYAITCVCAVQFLIGRYVDGILEDIFFMILAATAIIYVNK
jgi:hypothetical protein